MLMSVLKSYGREEGLRGRVERAVGKAEIRVKQKKLEDAFFVPPKYLFLSFIFVFFFLRECPLT